jgi:hypothetical protein
MIYEYIKTVEPSKLQGELIDQALPVIGISTEGTAVKIETSSMLSDIDKTKMDAYVYAHNPVDMTVYVAEKIINAMQFGRKIMAEYGASNVLAGLTVDQVKSVMQTLSGVQAAILTGSLYVALDEIAAITPDGTLITQAKLDKFKHKIQDYLQIPRT